MALQRLVVFSLLLAFPKFGDACQAVILGVCNHYNSTISLTSTRGDERCSAMPDEFCQVPSSNNKGVSIPTSSHASDYVKNHLVIASEDGAVNFKIWKNNRQNKLEGGYDYGVGSILAATCDKETQWNVVIHQHGTVTLWESYSAESCPMKKHTEKCLEINSKSGSWVAISSSSVEEEIEIETGVSREHEIENKNEWAWSVEESLKVGFDFFGAETSITVTGEQSGSVSKTYKDAFKEEKTTTETMGPFEAGTVWQWKWVIADACGTSTVTSVDVVSTKGKFEPPCCLPGYFASPEEPNGECHAGRDGKVYDLCKRDSLENSASFV